MIRDSGLANDCENASKSQQYKASAWFYPLYLQSVEMSPNGPELLHLGKLWQSAPEWGNVNISVFEASLVQFYRTTGERRAAHPESPRFDG
jgi:hypothetical protein